MTHRRTITERDVRRTAQSGATTLDVTDAVVTPSARDVARSLRVQLVKKADTGASPGVGPSTAGSPAATSFMVAIGADHGGVSLKDVVGARLREMGHTVKDLGTTGTSPVDYPDFAAAVAREVASGGAQLGIMVDGAGIGSCIAANKIRGVRAAMCYDITTATNAREHNNANVLTLGGGLIGPRLAVAIVETFIATPFAGGRHGPRVAKIDALDSGQ